MTVKETIKFGGARASARHHFDNSPSRKEHLSVFSRCKNVTIERILIRRSENNLRPGHRGLERIEENWRNTRVVNLTNTLPTCSLIRSTDCRMQLVVFRYQPLEIRGKKFHDNLHTSACVRTSLSVLSSVFKSCWNWSRSAAIVNEWFHTAH